MGITLCCKKSEKSYDLGYTGFMLLRKKIANLCNEEFGQHYDTITNAPWSEPDRDMFFQEFDKRTMQLIAEKKISCKIVDFCLQSDTDGCIHYGACKLIYKHVKDYDDNVRYGYSGQPDCFMFSDFKSLLKECIENKCDLVWK